MIHLFSLKVEKEEEEEEEDGKGAVVFKLAGSNPGPTLDGGAVSVSVYYIICAQFLLCCSK